MIDLHKKTHERNRESKSVIIKIKKALYSINHDTLHAIRQNPLIYKLLVAISYLQLIYFVINPKIAKMWTLNFVNYFRSICQYFQMQENL